MVLCHTSSITSHSQWYLLIATQNIRSLSLRYIRVLLSLALILSLSLSLSIYIYIYIYTHTHTHTHTNARALASNEICVNLYYSAVTTDKPLINFHHTPQFPSIRPTNDASSPYFRGAQLFQKSRNHFKILHARSTFHTEDPEMSIANV